MRKPCAVLQCVRNPFFSARYNLEKREYHGRDALLGGVVASGGVVPDHLSIPDVHTLTHKVDLRTHEDTLW